MTDRFSTYDGAYLLGALTPQDRASYEEHLAECAECRHGVHQLAGLPGLLAAVPPERARMAGEPGPDVPDSLLPRLLAEVQRARFRRRWTNGLVGAAAAAVLALVVAVGVQALSDPEPQASPGTSLVRHMVPASADVPITATASLADRTWGTLITIRCTYEGGSSPYRGHQGLTYTMVVVDRSGSTQQVAQWAAVPGTPAVVDGSTSVPQDEIASVQVRDPDDHPVLTLRP